jgi:hypothetical protein
MVKVLQAILTALIQLNPTLTAVGTVMVFVTGFVPFVKSMWTLFVAKIAAFALPASLAATAVSGYEFMDYIVPVHELFTAITAYCAVWVAAAIIRIIKSFIPTIA